VYPINMTDPEYALLSKNWSTTSLSEPSCRFR
jgi:hypothetical protein